MTNQTEQKPPDEDLDKDMQIQGDEYVNMEGDNRSTAAEGTLKTIEEDVNQEKNLPPAIKGSPEPPDATNKTTLAEDELLDAEKQSG